ncbi:putative odorant receptor 83c isoform X2 [Ooceraea biroi]|uniref:putative odorant receptor 83c isoform X2 n=1 Tax=Ooceraea biroi TaxID=2015173 RepID=UPI000F07DFB0|nr:putative odorant receptor 83c isoform X2 [Ooceraea biroi]
MEVTKHLTYRADYEWAIEFNRFNLTLLGIWPENNEDKQKKLKSDIRVVLILNIIMWTSIIPTLHSLLKIYDDIMLTIDNLQYTLSMLMALIKLIILWHKKYDILPVLNMIKDDWLRPQTSKEKNIMIKQARIARTLTIFSFFVTLMSGIIVSFLPLFGISLRYRTNRTDPGRLLPLQTYYLYNVSSSPLYEVTFLLQGFSVMASATIYSGTDTFMSMLVFHICGQLENLKTRIRNFDKFNNFANTLATSVKDHIRLNRAIIIIDDTFNLMLFGLLVYFGILFALFGFLFISIITQGRNLSIARLFLTLIAFTNSFGHMCLYCALGEYLVMRCDGIYDAVCQYEWYRLKPKQMKNFLNIMMQSRRPLHLTAGKLFPMTVATLSNLLKTSGGYISVLLAHRT